MVGIVIVAHSAKLAAGIKELAEQMVQTPVAIALAAGIDDPENPLGTEPLKVQAAIESVYSEAGVLVLLDLGSAILSAEMALEFLSPEQRSKIQLCAAPLVEGAIAAVVEASSGAALEQVLAAAKSALEVKAAQLGEEVATQGLPPREQQALLSLTSPHTEKEQRIQLTVLNPYGLHARPAAKFVRTAARFRAEIKLQNLTTNSQAVSAKSINQVMLLGVRQGNQIAISAAGEDATDALKALQKLIEDQFDAPSTSLPVAWTLPASASSLTGIAASPGIAISAVIFYRSTFPEIVTEKIDNPQSEWQKLQQAIETAKEQLNYLVSKENDPSEKIFSAYLLYLEAPELIEPVHQLMFEQHLSAASAWKQVIEKLVAAYQAVSDSYLQARASDLEDVGLRVLRLLLGVNPQSVDLSQAGILIAPDLTVSEIIQLKPDRVLGICTAGGSPTSHTALVANQLGIPMIVGVGQALLAIPAGAELGIDGATGQIWLEPDRTQRQKLLSQRTKPSLISEAITLDGEKIPVLANIIGIANAQYALDCGAEGVGLLRTEFLYLDCSTLPKEEEQLEIIEAIAKIIHPRPLTIRTLDIGGDKPVAYLNLPPETNPFLGWRGIRHSLDCPEILKTQLRAILQASAQHQIKLMFPMIASVREIREAKKLIAEVQEELREQKISFDPTIKIGIMIEVPAAVIMADLLATEVDFFSIGTNDLSQYTMAADRTNPKVAALADALEPAVLRMISQTVATAHQAGITVSVCGQLASEPRAIPILLGLRVDELSVNPPAIAQIKAEIGRWRKVETEAVASQVLQLDSAAAVKDYLAKLKTS